MVWFGLNFNIFIVYFGCVVLELWFDLLLIVIGKDFLLVGFWVKVFSGIGY